MNKWSVNKTDRKTVSQLSLQCGVSTLTAAVLASRGFSSAQAVMEKMNVSSLSDPFLIKDMELAADAINNAIDSGTKICVYGDYDCDGIMSSVMLYSYLQEAGADVFYYIPERSEGYGLNENAVRYISGQGAELIITVDNGISALNEAELIYELGMKLVVTDHHQPGETLPRAEAIVDPHRTDCFSPFKKLCGAGVVLKLIAALDGGDYTMALEQFGDLAAVATVADIVTLTGENRFIVSYGMQLLENSDRPSVIALKKVCSLENKKLNSYSIGFGIAPRINAAGRFGSPITAAQLFLCEEPEKCEELAAELNDLNNQRKEAENDILTSIYHSIDSNPDILSKRVLFICGKGWHHGVIGIIASKILERFGKPCFIASEENGEIRGSARSFGSFSIFGALNYASEALEKFGGHPGAGGFTIKSGMAEHFDALLQQYALENHENMPVLTITADAVASPVELTVDNIKGLELLEPFGADNEKPLFYIENAVVKEIFPLSNGAHSKLRLKYGYTEIDALIFRTSPAELSVERGDSCNIIAELGINSYNNNESVSIVVRDYRSSHIQQDKIISAISVCEKFSRGESLPDNYYKSMIPVRDEIAEIYVKIPPNGICTDTLFSRIRNPRINYCKFTIALQALSQLSLISRTYADNKVFRLKAEKKVDILSAPVLTELMGKIKLPTSHI